MYGQVSIKAKAWVLTEQLLCAGFTRFWVYYAGGGVGGASGQGDRKSSSLMSSRLGISVAELIAHFPTFLVSISLLLGNSQKMWSGSMAKEPVITHHARFYYLYGISRWKSIFSLVFCFLGGNSRRLQRSCDPFPASQWDPALSHPDLWEAALGSALL